ncbi:MAG: gluconokinase [Caldilinea sp.]|nr:gluconokinase [Caldilinea sp.]MDW8440141.1 gluconokinase [Caldilineaceae bacterium]
MADFMLLVLDIGTSSTRALVFDDSAQLLTDSIAQIPNAPHITPVGDVIFDADTLFAAVVEAIDRALATPAVQRQPVLAVAACTFVTNVVGLDAQERPLTPLFTYASPGCTEAVAELRAALGASGVHAAHERTGCPLHTSYLPARFHWMARHRPDWLSRAQRWLSIGDYVLRRLTGEVCTGYSVASWTGLLNRRTLQWDEEWLERLQLAVGRLPALVEAAPLSVRLQPEWARRWPALREAVWIPAVGDGAAANVGSGAVAPHQVALTIGTTGAMRVVVPADQPVIPNGLWLYRVTAQEALLGGATTEGGNLLAWLRKTLRLPSLSEIEAAMAAAPPAAHGVHCLPFIAGERAPGWNEAARAALIGFTQSTTPLDLYRAAMEAIAYRFALIYRLLQPSLPEEGRNSAIVASGGALTASPSWQQIVADVLGRPLTLLKEAELSARGVAILALRSLGVLPAWDSLPPSVAATIEPNLDHHLRHQAMIQEQSALYMRLFDGRPVASGG